MMRLEVVAFLVAALTFSVVPTLNALRASTLPILATLAVALLGLAQLAPLSSKMLRAISPESAAVYARTNELLGLFGKAAETASISIAPSETKQMFLLTLALIALFSSAVVLLRIRARRRLFAGVILASGLGHTIYAALNTSEERASGVFINPNHLAAYLEIALAMAFAILWNQVLVTRERATTESDLGRRLERSLPPLGAGALLWGAIAVGIGLTHSRGGIAAAAITTAILLTLGLVQLIRARRRRTIVTTVLVAVAAGGFAAATAGRDFVVRFLGSDPREIGADTRIQLWRTSLETWRHYPIFGSGLGTFREAFRPYQSRALEGLVEQAHSDPLQLLVTGGAIGALAGVVAIGSLTWILASSWAAHPRREEGAMILSGLAATVSLMIHGIAEFNFSIPAIPATYVVLAGLAMSAAADRDDPASDMERMRHRKASKKHRRSSTRKSGSARHPFLAQAGAAEPADTPQTPPIGGRKKES